MKNKSRVTKVILTAMVLLSMLLLSACELSKATPPPQPTLAVPINTVVVEDAAEEEASVEDSIEIIDTPEAEEETDADAKDVEEGEEAEDTAGEETEAETEEEAEEVEAEEETEPAEAEVPEIEVPETYTLMKDEFPYCIARRFDVNITELLNLNGLGGGVTYEGMVLKIPQDSAWNESAHGARSLRAHPVVYTVSAGDSIYSIACKFGDVSPAQIAAKNGLAEPYSLSPGQELQIP